MAVVVPAHATHGVEHRYTIQGRVVNADNEPVANAAVRVTGLGGRPLGKATTDPAGRYSVLLHVHDQDLGTKFWVTVSGTTKAGQVTFAAGDLESERGQSIDFDVPSPN